MIKKIHLYFVWFFIFASFNLDTLFSQHLNDVWAYYVDENRWEEIHPAGTLPEPRRCHTAAYDPINQRMIVTGGGYGYDPFITFNEIWSLALNQNNETWYKITPASGYFPGTLSHIDTLYSRTLNSIIGFYPDNLQNIWIWNMVTDNSQQITILGPLYKQYPGMAIDEKRNRIILYGGGMGGISISNELWQLDLTPGYENWEMLPQLGNPPGDRYLLRAVVDPFRDCFILYGGNSYPVWEASAYKDTTYELDLTSDTWTLVPAITPPSSRGQYGAVWDDVKRQMHVLCGLYRVGPLGENIITYNEIWTYDSDTQSWFQQLPMPDPDDGIPEVRRMPTSVFDEMNRRIILFGGEKFSPVLQVQSAIKIPRNGRKISGNRITIMAELIKGEITQVKDIRFQYRQPSITGTWLDIKAAGGNHPNPDTDFPYFIHWDVTGLQDGEVDLRAIATDISNVSDTAPDDITVVIDHNNPHTTETLTAYGHININYVIDNSALADIGVSDDHVSLEYQNAVCANVRIRIPSDTFTTGSVVSATFVDLSEHPEIDMDGGAIGYLAEIHVTGGQEIFPPGKRVNLRFIYPDNDQDGKVDNTTVHENTLKIYTPDGLGGLVELPTTIDSTGNTVSGETDHFSLFTIKGAPYSEIFDWNIY